MAFKGQDFDRLLGDLKSANYWWVLASVGACLMAHVLRAIRWNMLIEPLKQGTPLLQNTFYAVMIGYLANLAFPRMGEISRCGVIHKTDRIPLNQLIGTVITERLIDLLMLIVIIGLSIVLQYKFISSFLYERLLLKLGEHISYVSILTFASVLLACAFLVFYIVLKKNHWGGEKRCALSGMGLVVGSALLKECKRKGFLYYILF